MNSIDDILQRIETGAAELIPRQELVEKLERSKATGKPLRVKLGIDPSAPQLTLGHSVPLRMMHTFQALGHTGVLVVGDFTRRIGDPSGRSSSRAVMSEDEIRRNMESYQQQAFKILDPERTEIHYNSEWLGRLSFADVIELSSKYTVARMLERDDFANRFSGGRPISILEFLYPLAQGYDSVAIEADVELGGTDQRFNLLTARDIQREYGQEPQVILTVPLLIGTDGVKSMSQTVENYIGIDEDPQEMFGKLMAVPDALIHDYFFYLTDVDPKQMQGLPPRDAKRQLAWEIVRMYHGEEAADLAKEGFDRVFLRHERPTDVPRVRLDRSLIKEDGTVWVVSLLEAANLVPSRSQAKRLIAQGGVRINERRISSIDIDLPFSPPLFVQVGKRSFAELI
ncbi:MAG: tyrosine--tRNA ligase [Candidatus Bipolaricaulota bacterium]|nr:tyrosine--tRNA ligase [Candidatus Bipolaricaulota bacterium]